MLVCVVCGDRDCGAVLADVSVGEELVTWSNWRWTDYETPGETITQLPVFRFERREYQDLLATAPATHCRGCRTTRVPTVRGCSGPGSGDGAFHADANRCRSGSARGWTAQPQSGTYRFRSAISMRAATSARVTASSSGSTTCRESARRAARTSCQPSVSPAFARRVGKSVATASDSSRSSTAR